MKIEIEIDEAELRRMVVARLREMMPDADITAEQVVIQVKSKQNYRAEWEGAAFRARVEKYG